ncbi:hypothetical protein QOT17_001893 [Balamuthia mandrillaris]
MSFNTVVAVQGLNISPDPMNLGTFCSVIFEGEERTTDAMAPDGTWRDVFEFNVSNLSEAVTVVLKERKDEPQQRRKRAFREMEYGRVELSIAELGKHSGSTTIDEYFPVLKDSRPTGASVRLSLTYNYSMTSDLISIFSSQTKKKKSNKQPLKFSTLQYNLMRVVAVLLPIIQTIKFLFDLFRWKNKAASAFALQLFLMAVVMDMVAPLLSLLLAVHFVRAYVKHYKKSQMEFHEEETVEMTKAVLEQYMACSDERMRQEKLQKKGKKGLLHKLQNMQHVLGVFADHCEPLLDIWEFKNPVTSQRAMMIFAGLYMFTLYPLYQSYPRFKAKYHHKILFTIAVKRIQTWTQQTLGWSMVATKTGCKSLLTHQQVTVESLQSQMMLCGRLLVRLSEQQPWIERHCVLVNGSIHLFASDDANEKSQETISLTGCYLLQEVSSITAPTLASSTKSFFAFGVRLPPSLLAPSCCIYFGTPSEEERERWTVALSTTLVFANKSVNDIISSPSSSSSSIASLSSGKTKRSEGGRGELARYSTSDLIQADPSPKKMQKGIVNRGRSASCEDRPIEQKHKKKIKRQNSHNVGLHSASSTSNASAVGKKERPTVESLLDKTDRASWMHKKGLKNQSWKHRYFMLCGNELYYFKKSSFSAKAINKVVLSGSRVFSLHGDKKHPYCIDLYIFSEDRHYNLSLSSETERDIWVQLLQKVRQRVLVPISSVGRSTSVAGQTEEDEKEQTTDHSPRDYTLWVKSNDNNSPSATIPTSTSSPQLYTARKTITTIEEEPEKNKEKERAKEGLFHSSPLFTRKRALTKNEVEGVKRSNSFEEVGGGVAERVEERQDDNIVLLHKIRQLAEEGKLEEIDRILTHHDAMKRKTQQQKWHGAKTKKQQKKNKAEPETTGEIDDLSLSGSEIRVKKSNAVERNKQHKGMIEQPNEIHKAEEEEDVGDTTLTHCCNTDLSIIGEDESNDDHEQQTFKELCYTSTMNDCFSDSDNEYTDSSSSSSSSSSDQEDETESTEDVFLSPSNTSIHTTKEGRENWRKSLLHIRDRNGQTLLHVAAEGGNIDFVKRLLACEGCDLEVKDVTHGWTALHVAIIYSHYSLATFLLNFKKTSSATNTTNTTEQKKEKKMKTVEADVNAVSDDGNTALHYLCKKWFVEERERTVEEEKQYVEAMALLQSLLARGASVNALNSDGETPLHCAVSTK